MNGTEDAARESGPILVTGGTGRAGRPTVAWLREHGCTVRVLSRSSHENGQGVEFVKGDLVTGEGIEAAVLGAGVIVHCAASTKIDEDKAQLRTLIRAASEAGVGHLLKISVVGADRVPVTSGIDRRMFGYFAAMLESEQAVENSGLPWTTLRATQFHQGFALVARGMAKMPVIPVPSGVRFQPIDAREVGARLAELALGPPAGLVAEVAGPKVYGMAELIRGYLRARRKHRLLVPLRLPGKAARAVRDGAILAPDRAVGQRTWEAFLAEGVS
jgi:uncharacterized protein YbjT (DUF2867 family)